MIRKDFPPLASSHSSFGWARASQAIWIQDLARKVNELLQKAPFAKPNEASDRSKDHATDPEEPDPSED